MSGDGDRHPAHRELRSEGQLQDADAEQSGSAVKKTYNTIADMIEDVLAFRTANPHKSPEPEMMMTAGFPCEPFTTARQGRFATGSWQSHKLATVFFDIMQYIKIRRPKMIILENVRGFAESDGDDAPSTYLDQMFAEMGHDGHMSIFMDHDIWTFNSRDRLLHHRSVRVRLELR